MTKPAVTIGLTILVIIGGTIGYVGWWVYSSSHGGTCQVCMRPVHLANKTVALVDGVVREQFCCPTCARTFAEQTGRRVEIVQLTDYATRVSLDPAEAILVEGSDVNPCIQHDQQMTRDQDRQVLPLEFDRCAPSVLAFSDLNLAEDFIAAHGGRLVPLGHFMGE